MTQVPSTLRKVTQVPTTQTGCIISLVPTTKTGYEISLVPTASQI
jgi:hypothetical protein